MENQVRRRRRESSSSSRKQESQQQDVGWGRGAVAAVGGEGREGGGGGETASTSPALRRGSEGRGGERGGVQLDEHGTHWRGGGRKDGEEPLAAGGGLPGGTERRNSAAAATTAVAAQASLGGGQAEVYGFVCWMATLLAYFIFLVWAYLPDQVLFDMGITYFPSKSWAVGIPAYLVMTWLFASIVCFAQMLVSTPPLHSFLTVTDHEATASRADWMQESSGGSGVPDCSDMNIAEVNRILYQTPAQGMR